MMSLWVSLNGLASRYTYQNHTEVIQPVWNSDYSENVRGKCSCSETATSETATSENYTQQSSIHLAFLLGFLLHQYLCQNGKFSLWVKCIFYKYSIVWKHTILCSVGRLLPGGQILPAVDAGLSREGAPDKGAGQAVRGSWERSSKPRVWGTFVVGSQSHMSGYRTMNCMDRHTYDCNTAEFYLRHVLRVTGFA